MTDVKSCKGCPNRSVQPNCHTTCEVYAEIRKRSEKHRQLVHDYHDYEDAKSDAISRSVYTRGRTVQFAKNAGKDPSRYSR